MLMILGVLPKLVIIVLLVQGNMEYSLFVCRDVTS